MNYLSLQNKVTNIIKQYGMIVKIRHELGGSSQVYGIFGETENRDVNKKYAAGVTNTNRIIYISVPKKVPEVGDILIANNKEYSISKVTKYEPTNISIAYVLEVDA